jgi:hypothetical protein
MSAHLIISVQYQEYAIELTPDVAQAIPAILAAKKVKHKHGSTFEEEPSKSDLKISIGEVESGNN